MDEPNFSLQLFAVAVLHWCISWFMALLSNSCAFPCDFFLKIREKGTRNDALPDVIKITTSDTDNVLQGYNS